MWLACASSVCYRLYSQSDFSSFPPFNLPKIQRVRLESVVLQIEQLAGGGMDPRRGPCSRCLIHFLKRCSFTTRRSLHAVCKRTVDNVCATAECDPSVPSKITAHLVSMHGLHWAFRMSLSTCLDVTGEVKTCTPRISDCSKFPMC
jgi:hypothetical protein